MVEAKLEVGIIKGSILVKLLMRSGMCSKVVLRLVGATYNTVYMPPAHMSTDGCEALSAH